MFFWINPADLWPATSPQYVPLILPVLVVGGTMAVSLSLRWLRWHYLWRRLGVRIPTRKSILIFTALLLGAASPLALAEILVGLFLKQYSRAPWRLAVSNWLILRTADGVALALLASIIVDLGWMLFAFTMLVGSAAIIYVSSRIDRPASTRERLAELVVFISLSLASWTCVGIGVWLASFLIEQPLSFLTASSAFAKASLVGALSILPGELIHQLQLHGTPFGGAVQITLAALLGTVGMELLVGAAVWILRYKSLADMITSRQSKAQLHFDDLSASYDGEIPDHIRGRLLDRKVALMEKTLRAFGIASEARGFDLGCGQGWYAIEMAKLGFTMAAGDLSSGQVSHAVENGSKAGVAIAWQLLDGAHLYAESDSLSFVYTINVLHHITDDRVRQTLFNDIVRALRPGGILVVHEMNTRNPIFRLYMSYIFPLLRSIDDGTERWLDPEAPPPVAGGRWVDQPTYFTFLPDFGPKALFDRLAPLEHRLERSRLASWSAHYQHIFVKSAGQVAR
jgi:2-polyprenyl-3-methyl-5-hydroxy-6-metoxy-1,4-benzoquinol methylase